MSTVYLKFESILLTPNFILLDLTITANNYCISMYIYG